ncbi:MAG TPA: hypothetical protein V6D47_12920 [Oscillatoriaceae cyanobacterium]
MPRPPLACLDTQHGQAADVPIAPLSRKDTRMHRAARLALGLLASAALTACQTSAPSPAPIPSALPSPAIAPTTPAPFGVLGKIENGGQPVAGAAITASAIGRGNVLASGVSDAQGHFDLALPASVPAGTLVQLLGTKGSLREASLIATDRAAGYRVSDAAPTVVLNTASTLAFVALAPRLMAVGTASYDASGQLVSPSSAQSALSSFSQLESAAGQATQGDTSALSASLSAQLATSGPPQGLSVESLQQLGASAAPLAGAIATQANNLGTAIAQAVGSGGIKPASNLTGPITIGGNVVPEVFPGDDSGLASSVLGVGTGVTERDSDATGTLQIRAGQIVNTTASPTIQLN